MKIINGNIDELSNKNQDVTNLKISSRRDGLEINFEISSLYLDKPLNLNVNKFYFKKNFYEKLKEIYSDLVAVNITEHSIRIFNVKLEPKITRYEINFCSYTNYITELKEGDKINNYTILKKETLINNIFEYIKKIKRPNELNFFDNKIKIICDEITPLKELEILK